MRILLHVLLNLLLLHNIHKTTVGTLCATFLRVVSPLFYVNPYPFGPTLKVETERFTGPHTGRYIKETQNFGSQFTLITKGKTTK